MITSSVQKRPDLAAFFTELAIIGLGGWAARPGPPAAPARRVSWGSARPTRLRTP